MNEIDWPDFYGFTIFCDDVRQEVGGKASFMGVYSGSINIVTDGPTRLPKLCLAAHYFEKVTVERASSYELLVYFPGDEENPAMTAPFEIPKEGLPLLGPQSENSRVSLRMNIEIAPFPVQAEGLIRVRVKRGDAEIIKLGSLLVKMVPTSEARPVEG